MEMQGHRSCQRPTHLVIRGTLPAAICLCGPDARTPASSGADADIPQFPWIPRVRPFRVNFCLAPSAQQMK